MKQPHNQVHLASHKRHGFDPWVGKIPRGEYSNTLKYSCLENPHGQRSLVDYNPWDHKELDTSE